MQVHPSQLKALLEALIPQRLPALITGAPGIGKSDIIEQVAVSTGHDLLISHPVVEDPTDSKGLPFPSADGSVARFLPFGDLERALTAKTPLLWFLDDLGQASTAVQAAKMQLILARRIGEHRLPDCVTFVAATNRHTDNAGVSRILDPLKSRFATIVELVTSIEDWSKWAVTHDIHPMLIAFLRFRPDLLSSDVRAKGMTNVHSPRSWGFVSRMMGVIPAELELPAFQGGVGEGAAAEFLAFLQIARELPSPDVVLATPDTAPIPEKPSALYAIAAALAAYVKPANFDRGIVYAKRLIDAGHAEFAALFVRDALRRDSEISQTPAFITAQAGPIGQMIRGE
jgi:MoxR-like ATPase